MFKKTLSVAKITTIIALAALGAGCQTNKVIGSESLSQSSIEIIAQESQKALLAQQSYKTAQAENLRQIQVKQARFNVDLIDANYIGTPEVLLNSVANTFGYRYLEAGPVRSLPIVNFTNRKVTGFELVKDVGIFVDSYANIIVDHQNKTIVLQYK